MANKLVYARGQPERITLKETYSYKRELSRNQSTTVSKPPEGLLEIAVPYDGQQYFTRTACADVEHQLSGANPADDVDAQVGHVLFSAYDRTDLKEVLDLGEHYDALPISVPVVCDAINQPEHLYDDRRAALIRHAYQPRSPEIRPAEIIMRLTDEQSHAALLDEASPTMTWQQVAEIIEHQASKPFQLMVELQVLLALPNTAPDDIKVRVARAAFDWPTLTAFRTLTLSAGKKSPPLRYNPAKTCIEWDDVALEKDEQQPADAKTKMFWSPRMQLRIGQPGELYQQPTLKGTVELEIKDMLLSGTQLRVYDGAGAQIVGFKPELITRILIDLELVLDDAFARRTLLPYRQLFFEEVIPDRMRLADILVTLGDQGFQIEKSDDLEIPEGLRCWIVARRAVGPNTMRLWVIVDGRRYGVERQTELPGGQVYASTFASGELNVHMIGALAGNADELTHRMNTIQRALCDRFARLRAKR